MEQVESDTLLYTEEDRGWWKKKYHWRFKMWTVLCHFDANQVI